MGKSRGGRLIPTTLRVVLGKIIILLQVTGKSRTILKIFLGQHSRVDEITGEL